MFMLPKQIRVALLFTLILYCSVQGNHWFKTSSVIPCFSNPATRQPRSPMTHHGYFHSSFLPALVGEFGSDDVGVFNSEDAGELDEDSDSSETDGLARY